MADHVRHYSNGDIIVTWRPSVCRHGGICARGLPEVFNPRRRPWIELEHSDSETIARQVECCPSGALTWTSEREK